MVVILVKDISFKCIEDKTHQIAAGTKVYVDSENLIAWFNDNHFHICPSEFNTLN